VENKDDDNTNTMKDDKAEDDDLATSAFGKFGKLVSNERYQEAEKLLYTLQPSGVDMEIRTLEGRKSVMGAAKYFREGLARETGFEIRQCAPRSVSERTWMELVGMEGGKEGLAELCTAHEEGWRKLKERF